MKRLITVISLLLILSACAKTTTPTPTITSPPLPTSPPASTVEITPSPTLTVVAPPTATPIPTCIPLYGSIVFSSLWGALDPYALDPNGVLSIWRKADDAPNVTNLVYVESNLFTPENTINFRLGLATDPTELFDLKYNLENERYFSNITLEETSNIALYSIQSGCIFEGAILTPTPDDKEGTLAIKVTQAPGEPANFLHIEVYGPYVAPETENARSDDNGEIPWEQLDDDGDGFLNGDDDCHNDPFPTNNGCNPGSGED